MTGNKRKTTGTKPSKAAASPAARTDVEECDGLRLLDLLRARGARSWHTAVPVAEVVRALGGEAGGWLMLGRNLESRHFMVLIRIDECTGTELGFYLATTKAAVKEHCDCLRFAAGALIGLANERDKMLDDSLMPRGKSEDDDDGIRPVKTRRRACAA